jgi:hypothetical protein
MLTSRLLQCVVALGVAAVSLAAQQHVVIPATAADRDATSLAEIAGFQQRFRQQIVVHAAALQGFTELTCLTFRRDGRFGDALRGGRAYLEVRLATGGAAPAQASEIFAVNQSAPTLVFAGEVVIPDSPALAHRDAATWSAPHAVAIPFAAPFSYPGGALAIDLRGEPVAGARSPWWPVDCALYTHAGQVSRVGATCDPLLVVEASRASAQPGSSLVLLASGRPHSVGVVLLGPSASLPGLPLDAVGAPGCSLYVDPLVTIPAPFGAATRRAAADASLALKLPAAGHLLSASLGVQWLDFPSPVTPAGFATSEGLQITLAGALPPFDAVQVRSGPLDATAPWPAAGDVTVNRFPVLRLDGR